MIQRARPSFIFHDIYAMRARSIAGHRPMVDFVRMPEAHPRLMCPSVARTTTVFGSISRFTGQMSARSPAKRNRACGKFCGAGRDRDRKRAALTNCGRAPPICKNRWNTRPRRRCAEGHQPLDLRSHARCCNTSSTTAMRLCTDPCRQHLPSRWDRSIAGPSAKASIRSTKKSKRTRRSRPTMERWSAAPRYATPNRADPRCLGRSALRAKGVGADHGGARTMLGVPLLQRRRAASA